MSKNLKSDQVRITQETRSIRKIISDALQKFRASMTKKFKYLTGADKREAKAEAERVAKEAERIKKEIEEEEQSAQFGANLGSGGRKKRKSGRRRKRY